MLTWWQVFWLAVRYEIVEHYKAICGGLGGLLFLLLWVVIAQALEGR